MEALTQLWDDALAWLSALPDQTLALGGGGLVLLLGVVLALTQGRRKLAPAQIPQLQFRGFQVAPLGRDAFFKVATLTHPVVLSSLKVEGRFDILVKNDMAGHRLEPGREYSVLLETTGAERITPNFVLQLTFLDEQGHTFQQDYEPRTGQSKPPRLLHRKRRT